MGLNDNFIQVRSQTLMMDSFSTMNRVFFLMVLQYERQNGLAPLFLKASPNV